MIPILYERDEVSFTSNGLGRLRDCIECVVTEERNGIYECDFEYPVSGAHYNEITLGRIIAVTHDDTGDIQPFDIVSFEKNLEGTTTFHCTHISYRQSYLTASGTNINSLASALSVLATAEPNNPFSYSTDIPSTGYAAAFDGVPRTVRSLLGGVEGSILDTYGGEFEWDKFNVYLHSARGQARDFSIRYGVNMTEYNDDSNLEGSFSSCVPYWTDGETTVTGDRVDCTYPTATGRNECVPLDLTEKFESKPTKAQLETLALSTMQSQQTYNPTQTISVSFVRLQDSPEYVQFANLLQCNLCDTIKVIFPDYNMSGTFKIVKTVWDVLQGRYNEMELGTLSTTLSEALGIDEALERYSAMDTFGSFLRVTQEAASITLAANNATASGSVTHSLSGYSPVCNFGLQINGSGATSIAVYNNYISASGPGTCTISIGFRNVSGTSSSARTMTIQTWVLWEKIV